MRSSLTPGLASYTWHVPVTAEQCIVIAYLPLLHCDCELLGNGTLLSWILRAVLDSE